MICFKYAVLLAAILPIAVAAQAPTSPLAIPVPTTKVLAIGHLTAPMTPEVRQKIMPQEVSDTVKAYLAGKIDQWYTRQDMNGVVFLLNVQSVEEAHALLSQLPLDKNNLMQFELIPLGPLNPLRILLNDPPAQPQKP
jgi:hypothetical protein